MMNLFNDIWALTCEMSPYLLLGFLLAGLMHEFIPGNVYTRYLSQPNMRSVVLSALFGVPLPLCSCGVIPTAMGLRREGASKGATVAFLTATPQTGVDSIIATYSLMGLPFALIRPIAAQTTAVFAGALQNIADKPSSQTQAPPQPSSTSERALVSPTEDSQLSKTNENALSPVEEGRGGVLRRCVNALRYAFVDMMQDIGRWLVVGLVVAGLITALVPDGWFAVFQDNSFYSILFVLALSVPMYLCATGSIPIAVALMLKGLTPGAAFVLLMAGPASNMASILVIRKVLGTRSLALYLTAILVGAITFGLGIDYLCPSEWFTSALVKTHACCHEGGASAFSIACTAGLCLLLINALTPLKFWGDKHHCHADSCTGSAFAEGSENSEHSECSECSEKAAPAPNHHLVFAVRGMNCNHCAANVQRAIESLPGVESAEVSLADKRAVVKGEALDAEAIIEAVQSIGFDIEET